MARMTLMRVAGQEDNAVDADDEDAATSNAPASENDELDRIIDELQRKHWRGKKDSEKPVESEQEVSDEPDFVISTRHKPHFGGPLRGAM